MTKLFESCDNCTIYKLRIKELEKGLFEAINSLISISNAGSRGSNEYLQDMIDVRAYASSRVKAANMVLHGAKSNSP
jgi:hypothetical protein